VPESARRFAAAYDRRAADYAAAFEPTARPVYQRIVQLAAIRRGMTVLDLATGTGGVAREAAAKGARVVGLDVSAGMLAVARRTGPPTVTFELADATALRYGDASFDVVTCGFGLSHIPDPSPALNEVRRVLKRGGALVASCWGPQGSNPSRAAVLATLERYTPGYSDPLADILEGEEIWGDPERGLAMLRKAGFDTASVRIDKLAGVFGRATDALNRALAGPALGGRADAIAEAQQGRFRADALAAIRTAGDLSWWRAVNYYSAVA